MLVGSNLPSLAYLKELALCSGKKLSTYHRPLWSSTNTTFPPLNLSNHPLLSSSPFTMSPPCSNSFSSNSFSLWFKWSTINKHHSLADSNTSSDENGNCLISACKDSGEPSFCFRLFVKYSFDPIVGSGQYTPFNNLVYSLLLLFIILSPYFVMYPS